MCLITTQKEPLIAENDIQVFKILNDRLTSVFYNAFQYELNKLYKTQILESEDNYWAAFSNIDADNIFNEYETITGEKTKKSTDLAKHFKSFGQGFHASLEINQLIPETNEIYFQHSNCVIYNAIIPKGSLYYVNISKLVVSDQIIITGRYEK